MRISLALCTYNGEKYVAEQLESFLGQSRLPDELVVCDDHSSDGTVPLVRSFAARSPFPVRLFVNPVNLGSTKNFEQAIGLCEGDVIALSDQDDFWLPDKLARMERVFAEDVNITLVTGDAWFASPELKSTGDRLWSSLPFTPPMQARFNQGEALRLLLRYNVVTGATTAFRAKLRNFALPIPSCWVHDGWLALLAAATSSVRTLAEPVILYRQHLAQQIGGAKLSLGLQVKMARRMNEAYFAKQIACFESLLDRLTTHQPLLRDPDTLRHVREKVLLSRRQHRMRRVGRVQRLWLAFEELVRLRYHRYARGWKAWLADSLL